MRYLTENIKKDLSLGKMVLIGGPRQVGKTTLALSFLDNPSPESSAYLNWDFPDSREKIIRGRIPTDQPVIVLDEIHKFPEWRNVIKGLYDQYHQRHRFIITGSAKLDYYRFGGDSLQGRYFYYRLHPFSVSEASGDSTEKLFEHGGFPEPFFRNDSVFTKRWRRERIKKVTNDDLLELEEIQEVAKLQTLVGLLPFRVGSPLSIANLSTDLKLSFQTVDRYLLALENLYYCYRIQPFSSAKGRVVTKEKKLYLWDWSEIEDPAARWENFVASHLLKYCHFQEDLTGETHELNFLRGSNKLEIDFIVTKNHNPLFGVECKSGETQVSHQIKYFSERSNIPQFYQIHRGVDDFGEAKFRARVLPLEKFCKEVRLP